MHYSKVQLILFFLLNIYHCTCQNIKIDTSFHSNKIWKIEVKRNNANFGSSKTYRTYGDKRAIDSYQFYLNNKLYGLKLEFMEGSIYSITNFRNNTPIFNKTYYWNGEVVEKIYPTIKTIIKYDKFQKIVSIDYPDLKEKVIFYPNQTVKSIIVTDSTKKALERKYYEFSPEGVLRIEGIYADSFVQIADTIITLDPETYEEIFQIVIEDAPLKNGYWYYFTERGILQEKRLHKFFTDQKGKTIKN